MTAPDIIFCLWFILIGLVYICATVLACRGKKAWMAFLAVAVFLCIGTKYSKTGDTPVLTVTGAALDFPEKAKNQ